MDPDGGGQALPVGRDSPAPALRNDMGEQRDLLSTGRADPAGAHERGRG